MVVSLCTVPGGGTCQRSVPPPPITPPDKAGVRPPLCRSRLAIVSNVFEINVSHSMGLVPELIIYAESGLAAEEQEHGKYFMFLH